MALDRKELQALGFGVIFGFVCGVAAGVGVWLGLFQPHASLPPAAPACEVVSPEDEAEDLLELVGLP